ncbi:hypothetical protein NL676_011407 [Syzygium grande]|nr:hypothetical protein NL676_011407 [Syzygium grande]
MRTDSSAAAPPALTDRHPGLRAAQQQQPPPTIPPTSAPCRRKGISRRHLRPGFKVATPWPTEIREVNAAVATSIRGFPHVQMAASNPRPDTMGDLESRRKVAAACLRARGRDLNGKETEHSDHSGGRWVCSGVGGGWATHLGSWRRWGFGGGASVGCVLH